MSKFGASAFNRASAVSTVTPRGESEVSGGHQTTCCLIGMDQEFPQILRLLLFHSFEDLLRPLFRKVAQEVGGIAGGHLFENRRGLLHRDGLDQSLLNLWIDLLQASAAVSVSRAWKMADRSRLLRSSIISAKSAG